MLGSLSHMDDQARGECRRARESINIRGSEMFGIKVNVREAGTGFRSDVAAQVVIWQVDTEF